MTMTRPLSVLKLSLKSYSSLSTENTLKVGEILKQSRVFNKSNIAEYSKLTYDFNPLHSDQQCAKQAGFKDVIVPGMLVASLFPRIIASYFPGAVYVKQTLDFRSPVFIEDEIIAEVQARTIRQMKEKFMVKFATTCVREGDEVVGGEAMAVLPTLAFQQLQF